MLSISNLCSVLPALIGADDHSHVFMGFPSADAHGRAVLLFLLPDVQVPAALRVHQQRPVRRLHVV